MASLTRWKFWVDTGGTFTDCLAEGPDGKLRRLKVLSTGAVRGEVVASRDDLEIRVRGLPMHSALNVFAGYHASSPGSAKTALIAGSRMEGADTILVLASTLNLSDGAAVDVSAGEEAPVLAMRMFTGRARDAVLPDAELRLATTRGTNALLEGKGALVAFFVTEGFGDLLRIGDQRRPDLFALRVEKPPPLHGPVVEVAERLGSDGSIIRPLDRAAVRAAAVELVRQGVTVAAVALMHSYRNPAHELAVADELRAAGFTHVSLSAALAPTIKIVSRAETAVVDAVLAPVMERYLSGVGRAIAPERFFVMTSAGGLVRRDAYRPKDSLLSGPAGGVAGAVAAARRAGLARVLTFDMGGTSTDVARWSGDFDYQHQHRVGAARVVAAALRVESVAAGGGSICRFDGAAFVVGPESAGAAPGPACYGGGGPLTLTDVHLLMGRLNPAHFAVPVSGRPAEKRFGELLDEVRRAGREPPAAQETLEGFLAIANERMAEAIRRISLREGYDPAEHALVAFGGAGGLHACAIAERLGVEQLLFPADSGLLSAAGVREAVPERFAEQQILAPLETVRAELAPLLARLEAAARAELAPASGDAAVLELRRAEIDLRFTGQENAVATPALPLDGMESRFRAAYVSRFGYVPTDRAIEVVTVRVVVSAPAGYISPETFLPRTPLRREGSRWSRDELRCGDVLNGPALISDAFSTLFIAAGWRGVVGSAGSILADHCGGISHRYRDRGALVELELFTCRFTALVEEMGELLQRCAVSVNVKERGDFSCALLDTAGNLVANAPHIPVHLGALGLCVREVREHVSMEHGDVIVTNHPAFGGSHLPDVTLIAPVHADDGSLLGYVANRAHHAEIGGVHPGSMSPQATRLIEEGVVIAPMHLVRDGVVDWPSLRARLSSGPHPSRRVEENLADLQAQLAAIRQGVAGLRALAGTHGAARVREFMQQLQERAGDALVAAGGRLSGDRWCARDALDDGTMVQVTVTRRRGSSRLRFDFSGSGAVHPGNLNATAAIVRSATLYVLRLLAGQDLPLNEGLMRDVELVVPSGVLAPDFCADPAQCPAVAGGNVETSQRVVDVLLRALALAACSQGTMNNLTFGTDRLSYYETIGGGTGAGPGFAGCAAVHSHMTNTAITDPEVIEGRWPVRVERFAIRRNSGGAGAFRGGDGIERRLRFNAAVALSLLTQRRACGPSGLAGGEAGAAGAQWIERVDGRREHLGAIAQVNIAPGDIVVVQTPGGGGWGPLPV